MKTTGIKNQRETLFDAVERNGAEECVNIFSRNRVTGFCRTGR